MFRTFSYVFLVEITISLALLVIVYSYLTVYYRNNFLSNTATSVDGDWYYRWHLWFLKTAPYELPVLQSRITFL